MAAFPALVWVAAATGASAPLPLLLVSSLVNSSDILDVRGFL